MESLTNVMREAIETNIKLPEPISVNTTTAFFPCDNESKIQNYLSKIKEFNVLAVEWKKRATEVNYSNIQANNLITQLKEKLNEKENEIKVYEGIRKTMEGDIVCVKNKYEELHMLHSNSNDKYTKVIIDKENLEKKIVCIEEIMEKKDFEIVQMKMKEAELLDARQMLHNLNDELKISNYENRNFATKIKKLKKKIKINKRLIKDLKNKITYQEKISKAKDFEMVETEWKYSQRENDSRKKYENQCSELQYKLKDLNKAHDELLIEFKNLNNELKIKNDVNGDLEIKINQQYEQIQNNCGVIKDLKNELRMKNDENNYLTMKTNEQYEQIQNTNCDIKYLKNKVTGQEEILKTKNSEMAEMKYKYSQCESETRTKYENQYSELQGKFKGLSEAHDDLLVRFTDVNKEFQMKNDEIKNLAIQIYEQNEKIHNDNGVIKDLKTKVTCQEETIKTKDSEIAQIKCKYFQREDEPLEQNVYQYSELLCQFNDINRIDNTVVKFDEKLTVKRMFSGRIRVSGNIFTGFVCFRLKRNRKDCRHNC